MSNDTLVMIGGLQYNLAYPYFRLYIDLANWIKQKPIRNAIETLGDDPDFKKIISQITIEVSKDNREFGDVMGDISATEALLYMAYLMIKKNHADFKYNQILDASQDEVKAIAEIVNGLLEKSNGIGVDDKKKAVAIEQTPTK